MSNSKFFSSAEIYVRLISSFPKKGAELNKILVQRWCGELVAEVLRDPGSKIRHNKVRLGEVPNYKITSNKVLLPDNLYKLEGVFDGSNRLISDYSNQGQYLYFAQSKIPNEVYIDYYSLPMDLDGFPLIKRGYELACYSYCVYKMYEEDATCIPPRIQQWRWFEIGQTKDWEIEAAVRAWDDMTDNDIMDIHNYLVGNDYALFYQKFHADRLYNKNALTNKESNIE